MKTFSDARKIFLKFSIIFLSISSVIAIYSVLTEQFGKMTLKVLFSTLTMAVGCLCVMAQLIFIEKKSEKSFGVLGIISAVIAAAFFLVGIWFEFSSEEYWKKATTFLVITVGLTHAFLLLLPDLIPRYRWTQFGASITIAVLAFLIILWLWTELNSEEYFKLMTIIAILVVLFSIMVPIFGKMSKETKFMNKTLVLTKGREGYYSDSQGNIYQVTPTNLELEDIED